MCWPRRGIRPDLGLKVQESFERKQEQHLGIEIVQQGNVFPCTEQPVRCAQLQSLLRGLQLLSTDRSFMQSDGGQASADICKQNYGDEASKAPHCGGVVCTVT